MFNQQELSQEHRDGYLLCIEEFKQIDKAFVENTIKKYEKKFKKGIEDNLAAQRHGQKNSKKICQ